MLGFLVVRCRAVLLASTAWRLARSHFEMLAHMIQASQADMGGVRIL